MPQMGSYCKAYLARQLREFPDWTENLANLRPRTSRVDGKEIEETRNSLSDDDILYVQENYVVTDGIYMDENIVFDGVTEQWTQFCNERLSFSIPKWEPVPSVAVETGAESAATG
jgi:hypothetical protein